MPDIDLRERFPDMTPLKGSPTLFRVNGCGIGLYGSRDRDAETGTYVKTRCLCAVFVPLLAIDSFRVADARGGWQVLGKQPLSAFAKGWNLLLVIAIASLVGVFQFQAWLESPEHQASIAMAKATRAEAGGDLGAAIADYHRVATGTTSRSVDAKHALASLVSGGLAKAPFAIAAKAVHQLAGISDVAREPSFTFPKLAEQAMILIGAHAGDDPADALAMLEDVARIDPKRDLGAQREHLLEALVTKYPDDPEWASRLAQVSEARGDVARCEQLLAPHATRLGALEGARILGRIYAGQGRFTESFPLLSEYCAKRLNGLKAAEAAYHTAFETAAKAANAALNDGQAGEAWYSAYKSKSKDEQGRSVDEWEMAYIKRDPALAAAQAALAKAAEIVPVALDLGIVTLQRAQTMTDPGKRHDELQAAEKTFLAIRGVAGDSDEYRQYYGQVLYWLGKPADGRKEFDDLLTARKRAPEALLGVAAALRQVGSDDEARPLAEEAYGAASEEKLKHAAARMRSLLSSDVEGRAQWLERCDVGDPMVAAPLDYAKGMIAVESGREGDARQMLQRALDTYTSFPKSAFSLNDGALAALGLFEIDSDRAMLARGNAMMEEALALLPADTILQQNLAYNLIQAGAIDAIGTAIDQRALHLDGDLSLLELLYHDEAGRIAVDKTFTENPDTLRAMTYCDRLAVLAPRGSMSYSLRLGVLARTRDLVALTAMKAKLAEAKVDLAAGAHSLAEAIAGRDRDKRLAAAQAKAKRFEAILGQPGFSDRGPTFAAAAIELIEARLAGWHLGQAVDADACVRLAEQAHAAAESAATWRALIKCLVFRAGERLAASDGEYATLVKTHRTFLSHRHLLPVAMARSTAARGAMAADADFVRAAALVVERMRALPSVAHPLDWALLEHVDPAGAAECTRAQTADHVCGLLMDLEFALAPSSPSNVLEAYWRCREEGDADGGRTVIAHAREQAIPVPDME